MHVRTHSYTYALFLYMPPPRLTVGCWRQSCLISSVSGLRDEWTHDDTAPPGTVQNLSKYSEWEEEVSQTSDTHRGEDTLKRCYISSTFQRGMPGARRENHMTLLNSSHMESELQNTWVLLYWHLKHIINVYSPTQAIAQGIMSLIAWEMFFKLNANQNWKDLTGA